ncbi:AraC family transcriptional regulator [Paenibacillus sp. YYML68]|uniref:AraC family transcriptional regulator n=1 Tax=Paenibacillus sp. YYML68 TaxID=2909250 RepID=UPI0024923A95|nr:AraC family transcriptional regulator [Paenibacillus sp. YYML68]
MYVIQDTYWWEKLHIRTRWVRDMRLPHSYQFGPVSNPFTVCWLVLEGTRRLEVDHEVIELRPGDLVFFRTNSQLKLHPTAHATDPFHYFSIGCELTLFSIDIPVMYGFPLLHHLNEEQQEALSRAWLSLFECYEMYTSLLSAMPTDNDSDASATEPERMSLSHALPYWRLNARVYDWLHLVIGFLNSHALDLTGRLDSRVMKVCMYVHHHYKEPLSLQSLCEHVYLSQSHLSHLFVQMLGMPPMEYVRRARLHHAKLALIDSSMSLKQIAAECGYESQSHFSRAFKHAEGMSPMQYRNRWSSLQQPPGYV